MAQSIIRAVGYVGARQVFTWPSNASYNNNITAYLWGAGGGGGGNDAYNQGGQGGGGGFSQVSFSANPGDVIEVSIGGPGTGGASSQSSAAGGSPGSSLILGGTVFNSLNIPGAYRVTNGAYCTFLNNFGVWGDPGGSSASFNRDITVNFPSSGVYTFEGSVDNAGQVYIDGGLVLNMPGEYGFVRSFVNNVAVGAGNHTISIRGQNWHGPGSFGLVISGGVAYSGGVGGRAGSSGSSGGGGGGGGATVLRVNGAAIAVAGGGGGGGGSGITSGTQPGNAPGPTGQAGAGINNGQDGGNRNGDGGGGGAGGGGNGGGNGGPQAPYDTWGYAGYFGGSLGNAAQNPSGRSPGGTGNGYWTGGVGLGGVTAGAGTPGYAVFDFEIDGTFIHTSGGYQNVKQTWVKSGGVWYPARGVYANINGSWQPVDGTLAPNFTAVGGDFGYSSRP
jgi:hypothetical protein